MNNMNSKYVIPASINSLLDISSHFGFKRSNKKAAEKAFKKSGKSQEETLYSVEAEALISNAAGCRESTPIFVKETHFDLANKKCRHR
jgi:hypothetical protein